MADIVMKTISSEELMKMSFPNIEFCIEDLIPKGLTVLTGPLWSGKSCLALDLCWRVAGNTPIWDLEVTPGDAHYIFMDDTMDRVVNRAKRINEGMPKEGRKICIQRAKVTRWIRFWNGCPGLWHRILERNLWCWILRRRWCISPISSGPICTDLRCTGS